MTLKKWCVTMNKKVLMIIDDYYKIPVRDLLEKLLNCEVEVIYNSNLENALEDDGNIILNYHDKIMFYNTCCTLKKKGYKFESYNISNDIFKNYKIVKNINPNINIFKYIKYTILIKFIIYLLSNIQMYIRKNIGFEINDGSFDRIIKTMNNNIHKDENIIKILKKYFYYKERFNNIALDKPKKYLKLGIISNEYISKNLYYDYTLEKLLSNKNIEPLRYINNPITNRLKTRYYRYKIRKYCKNNIGNNIIKNIYNVLKLKKRKCNAVLLLMNKNNYQDIILSILLESICFKEKMTFLKLDFEIINEEKLENNINAFYDILNLNK